MSDKPNARRWVLLDELLTDFSEKSDVFRLWLRIFVPQVHKAVSLAGRNGLDNSARVMRLLDFLRALGLRIYPGLFLQCLLRNLRFAFQTPDFPCEICPGDVVVRDEFH